MFRRKCTLNYIFSLSSSVVSELLASSSTRADIARSLLSSKSHLIKRPSTSYTFRTRTSKGIPTFSAVSWSVIFRYSFDKEPAYLQVQRKVWLSVEYHQSFCTSCTVLLADFDGVNQSQPGPVAESYSGELAAAGLLSFQSPRAQAPLQRRRAMGTGPILSRALP